MTVTVLDPSAAVIPGARLVLTDLRRGVVTQVDTNDSGFAVFDFLQPGEFSLEASKQGFEKHRLERFTLQVRDRLALRLELKVLAAANTSVEVSDKAEPVSNDAAQGISVERQFIQNLPANGRNAESLILMTPGITTAAGGKGDGGFNANGLRSNTNYYTLDGVSMNRPTGGGGFGGPGGGPGGGGPAPGAGSATEMITIDGMQEMKVQTSPFAPEFGRSPGAQVSMTSRGGTNSVHGAVFEYKRSEEFDGNDWFANAGAFQRAREHQDRPGGVLGGPIVKNKAFFFLSFEKLQLESPQSIVADVPDRNSRQTAAAALQSYLNVFPLPNGANLGNGAAKYQAVISNPSRSNSESARIDHVLNGSTTLFARFSLSPSSFLARGSGMQTPNVLSSQSSHSQLATLGVTRVFSAGMINDLRVNYSRSVSSGQSIMDNYGGSVPLTDSQVFPAGVTSANGTFSLMMMGFAGYSYGGRSRNAQQQVNAVDNLTRVKGNHHYKAGFDYREVLQTTYRNPYSVSVSFNGLETNDYSFLTGVALNGQVSSSIGSVYPTYRNYSAYGQDTWRATDRTTVTYGLRWDLNPAPTTRKGPKPFALSDSSVAGVTQNEPLYPTRWFNLAPRFGVAYLSDDTPGREMVLRAGLGMFHDLGYGIVDSAFFGAPYSNVRTISEAAFPLAATYLSAPSLPPTRPYGQITTGSSSLQSPVIYQFNGTWEKNFGSGTMLSIGAAKTKGTKLMRTETQPSYSAAYDVLRLATNGASSDYNGMQIQFRRRMSDAFQAQWSFTWAHSIDTASSDSGFGSGFASLFGNGERGSSDYDVRKNLSMSGSIRMPAARRGILLYPLRHWYLDFMVAARTGLPFDIQGVSSDTSSSGSTTNRGLFANVRPNVVSSAIWIVDSNVPGGKRLNKGAFEVPSGYEQGNLGRNALRGFGFGQMDLSLRRMIPITERFQLSLAAQGYNITNHPNFANPSPMEGGNMSSPDFGVVTRMMNQSFGGGVNALYRSGGPRSMEFSVRFQF